MNRNFLRILSKNAFGYVMENHIINKCGFFSLGYVMDSRIIRERVAKGICCNHERRGFNGI